MITCRWDDRFAGRRDKALPQFCFSSSGTVRPPVGNYNGFCALAPSIATRSAYVTWSKTSERAKNLGWHREHQPTRKSKVGMPQVDRPEYELVGKQN